MIEVKSFNSFEEFMEHVQKEIEKAEQDTPNSCSCFACSTETLINNLSQESKLPFELALIAAKTQRKVKRKHHTNSMIFTAGAYYTQTETGDLIKYTPTNEDLVAEDWSIVND